MRSVRANRVLVFVVLNDGSCHANLQVRVLCRASRLCSCVPGAGFFRVWYGVLSVLSVFRVFSVCG